ncbi:aminotransferase class IV [Mangrovibacterium lignilyticum]|uniref:aminotransferase class IV n=1 Tax=Mangrovibacterium lignilyticum TaxID=2668052 RepID=UPI0013CF538A|nr:aminotransferase class IV [Mangrovibacterium lignilyticum]
MAYILYDGNFYSPEEHIFSPTQLDNLLFRDELKVIKSNILFWEDHLKLLSLCFQLFKIDKPTLLANNGKELKRQIERSLVKNKYYRSAKIRISFFKQQDSVSYLIQLSASPETDYVLHPEGFEICLFKQITKSDSPLSSLVIGSQNLWEIAFALQEDEKIIPVILNNEHCLLETPGANLFILNGQTIITPHPTTGAYINPAKRIIQQIAGKIRLNFKEVESIYEEDLINASEVFLADDIRGVQFVRAFGMTRYYKKQSMAISEEFNRLLIH